MSRASEKPISQGESMISFIRKFLDQMDKIVSEDSQLALERIIAASARCPADVDRIVRQYEMNKSRGFL
jgi:hypothetical protein